MSRLVLVWIVALLLTGRPVTAGDGLAVSGGNVIVPDLLFEHFSSKNGIPDDRVRTIFQDHKGYLWIGTMNGLSRYDGYSFKRYFRKKQTNSVVGNWTYAFCEDDRNMLWIGTKEGLSRFDPQTETFTNFRHNPADTSSLFCDQINTLLYDKRGQLWIGTPQGVTRYNPVTRRFRRLTGFPFNTVIRRIIPSAGDFIWIATDAGPVRYNTRTDQYELHRLTVRPNPYGDRFWSLLEDNRHLYIGTGGDGLIRLHYDEQRGVYDRFEPLDKVPGLRQAEVFDIRKGADGSFWLGTDRGIMRLDQPASPTPQLQQYRHNPLSEKSISNDRVYTLFIDRTNVLWSGTENGINKLNLQLLPFRYFTFSSQRASDQIRSLWLAPDQQIWLGTAQSGLYRYNLRNGTTQTFRFGSNTGFRNHYRSVFMDAGGSLWLGTLSGAVRVLPDAPSQARPILNGAAVFAFLQDRAKNIWIGTNNGLYTIKPDGSYTRFVPAGSGGQFVRSLYEDRQGHLWVGFENIGLYRFDPANGRFLPVRGRQASEQLVGKTVYTIIEHPRNVLWVGTESGLNKVTLQGQTGQAVQVAVKTYQEEDGLPDQSVNGLLTDRRGNLWISTIRGLARFNPQTGQCQVFLPSLAFTHGCQFAIGDKLLFGASEGFVLFNPDEIRTDAPLQNVVLSDLRIFNKEVAIGAVFNGDTILNRSPDNASEITLNHLNNGFTIGFTGLHLSDPGQSRYAYRLEGFDRDWIQTGAANRSATYTNLNPGTYVFLAKAANSAGQWNRQPARLRIRILPPPWKTWWAIGLYILAFNVLLYVFVRYLLTLSRQRQQLRYEQLEKEQMQNLNQLKLRFFTDVSHEFRTPLSLIVAPVEDMLAGENLPSMLREKMQLIQRNCRKLLQLIDELMTFQKMEQGMLKLNPEPLELVGFVETTGKNFMFLAEQKGVVLRLTSEVPALRIWADAGKLEKIINNLLSNALRFTPAGGAVRVHIRFPDEGVSASATDWIQLTVEDTGSGIRPEALVRLFERFYQADEHAGGTGVGLSLTKSLVELHGGTITASSEPGIRTCFIILLPVNQNIPGGLPAIAALPPAGETPNAEQRQAVLQAVADEDGSAEGTSRPLLLLVDDNAEILNYLELAFQDAYAIRRAENGKQAIERIHEEEPDLIISDIMMPKMDGITLCRTLKSNLATCHIPIILLTARSMVEQKIEGLTVGADDYFPKPFHPGLLRVRVEKLIEFRRQLLARFQAAPEVLPKELTRNPLDEAFLQKVVDSTMANLSNEDFSVEELGELVNMSRSNLFRKLKAITGLTPTEFIYQVRLKHARELLLERRLNMSEISYEVGFKTPSSFTKAFRRHFGKAPTDYLNDWLQNQQPESNPVESHEKSHENP